MADNRKKIVIIGGGISGLSAAWFIKEKFGSGADFRLYEKDSRLGGTIGTTREEGYTVDWGSNGFLDREPLTLEMIDKIGLKDRLYPANDKSTRRFICRGGRLWEISPHPVKFMKSGLLSLKGRLRIPLELFIPAKRDNSDESIYDFAARRIGREAAEILIDPMVSGIFGGDARQLSLGACFPVMEKMEREYGGLFKAMIKKKRERKDKKGGGPAGPTGHLTSFRGGLYTLIEKFQELLEKHITLNTGVEHLTRAENGRYLLTFSDRVEEADIIILAVPAYHAARILKTIDNEAADDLLKIPYSNLAVVCQGFRHEDVMRPLDGFGFLVPHSEKMRILGSIWTSVIFPEQAPPGTALFRTMLGGALDNEIIRQEPEKLAEMTISEMSPLMQFKCRPVFQRVFIWDRAIPQYTLGHRERLEKLEKRLEAAGNIFLAGNAYSGIGLNDCIKRSYNIVSQLKMD